MRAALGRRAKGGEQAGLDGGEAGVHGRGGSAGAGSWRTSRRRLYSARAQSMCSRALQFGPSKAPVERSTRPCSSRWAGTVAGCAKQSPKRNTLKEPLGPGLARAPPASRRQAGPAPPGPGEGGGAAARPQPPALTPPAPGHRRRPRRRRRRPARWPWTPWCSAAAAASAARRPCASRRPAPAARRRRRRRRGRRGGQPPSFCRCTLGGGGDGGWRGAWGSGGVGGCPRLQGFGVRRARARHGPSLHGGALQGVAGPRNGGGRADRRRPRQSQAARPLARAPSRPRPHPRRRRAPYEIRVRLCPLFRAAAGGGHGGVLVESLKVLAAGGGGGEGAARGRTNKRGAAGGRGGGRETEGVGSGGGGRGGRARGWVDGQ
jgi:hypothetical protein